MFRVTSLRGHSRSMPTRYPHDFHLTGHLGTSPSWIGAWLSRTVVPCSSVSNSQILGSCLFSGDSRSGVTPMLSGTETPFAPADNRSGGLGSRISSCSQSRYQADAQGESAEPHPALCSGRHAAIGPVQMQQSLTHTNGRDFCGCPLFHNQSPVSDADTVNQVPGPKLCLYAKANS